MRELGKKGEGGREGEGGWVGEEGREGWDRRPTMLIDAKGVACGVLHLSSGLQ